MRLLGSRRQLGLRLGFHWRAVWRNHFGIDQLDVQAQRTHFLDEHVEAFRHACFERVVAAHDRLVDLCAARDVVRFDGEHFLEGISCAIGLECPDFHFSEALTAELRLTAQRLLGDKRVRTNRTGMDLVVDKMVQFQNVFVADGHFAVERLARTSVEQRDLTRRIEPGHFQHLDDVFFARAIEHGRCDRHAASQIFGE